MTDSIAVVGGGVMGLAAASALASKGWNVTLFERHVIGTRRGSSWGGTRIFRVAYDDPVYVRAARISRELWAALEIAVGNRLIGGEGGIDYGNAHDVASVRAALVQENVDHEVLSADEASRRWPCVRFDGEVLFEPTAGVIRSTEALVALQNQALARDVQIREQTEVLKVSSSGDRVSVTTAHATEVFDGGVAAVGTWTQQLVGSIRGPTNLVVTEEFPLEYVLNRMTALPVAIHHTSIGTRGDGPYWLPTGPRAIKVGAHGSGRVMNHPDDRSLECPPILAEALEKYVKSAFHVAKLAPYSLRTGCTYTSTTDCHFIIEKLARLVVLAGFSGEGFKFAPLIGRLAAAMLADDVDPSGVFPRTADCRAAGPAAYTDGG